MAEREVLSAELRIMGANNSLKGKTSLAIVCLQVITIFYWLEICGDEIKYPFLRLEPGGDDVACTL